MPRSVRIEYEGAVYHVLCRGDRQNSLNTKPARGAEQPGFTAQATSSLSRSTPTAPPPPNVNANSKAGHAPKAGTGSRQPDHAP